MKKIVCPRCGVVNLEKFVTFPHCAGCSALLPTAREPQRASVWRRPLRVGLWASLVGVALAGVMALSFSAPESNDPQRLALYAQLPRRVKIASVLVCRVSLESARLDGREVSVLREVSWRLPSSVLHDWRVVSVSPAPDSELWRGGRPLWSYRRWPADERWTLKLQARGKGSRKVAINVSAADHFPAQWHTAVKVN